MQTRPLTCVYDQEHACMPTVDTATTYLEPCVSTLCVPLLLCSWRQIDKSPYARPCPPYRAKPERKHNNAYTHFSFESSLRDGSNRWSILEMGCDMHFVHRSTTITHWRRPCLASNNVIAARFIRRLSVENNAVIARRRCRRKCMHAQDRACTSMAVYAQVWRSRNMHLKSLLLLY